ncbi:MAG: helix-turn-helix domain-containing protein [Betaproteobacteria bacterium]|jgi:AraC-like DNA-binding protein|nr:AraC family transcriptional regulator [Rubrivivax sp.]
MSDFASAAMMRVLAQGLREQGLDPGAAATASTGARVELDLKRALLQRVVAQRGLHVLPLLGRGLHRLTHEPTHQALAAARSPRDLFERWLRLERYIHSRHRCVVEACREHEAHVRHVSLRGGAPPSAAEDLVVAGVLAALLEAIGLQRVRLHVGGVPALPEPDAAGLAQAARRGRTAGWQLAWDGSVPPPAPGTPPPRELGADLAWPEPARATYRHLVRDLTRPLPLRELAAEVGTPWRTLQRRLGEAGLSYSRLLAEARCRSGAWRLLHTVDPIAEVGFLSGFADQAHFTRELQRRVGLPPAAYRAAFGATSGAASGAGG